MVISTHEHSGQRFVIIRCGAARILPENPPARALHRDTRNVAWEYEEGYTVVFTVPMNRRRALALAGTLLGGAAFARLETLSLPTLNLALPMVTAHAEGSVYFPPMIGEEWEAIPPAAVGWNENALEDALRFAGEQGSAAVMILYKGRILVERYWDKWDGLRTANTFSAGKSVTAILTGIAHEAQSLDLDAPVTATLGAGWSRADVEAEERITVRHLLAMMSGLDENLRTVAAPGTVWAYNTPAYNRVQDVIVAATGKPYDLYAREMLFNPVGMHRSRWQNTHLFASTRDMARFGMLMLNNGNWNGTDVVHDKNFLAAATVSSQRMNPSYGYLWWVNGREGYLLPKPQVGGDSVLVPAAPPDMFAAYGAGDKKIYVVPSMDLVVVRHGMAAEDFRSQIGSRFDNAWWQKLSTAAPIPLAQRYTGPFIP